ncbi:antimicrobial peptide ABC transporter permease [Catenovulum agarivorans DS-2]|uniref:Antimicrobial peptide ABC transporter permease n=1 Tax=Catenovulum agarivorans DS-2 TaxID=1328313 RepID=W7QSD1_9ALTE|nr:ABC transporter permease [Catenovulum agarivorans]EWH10768.1 antimicrobial peptide ABC transporter permease [Catenovulum agarivorans DS-2]
MFLKLAHKSLRFRKNSVLLTIFAMAISLTVLLGVEHIRQQTKHSFASSVSGIDLIIGTRTSQLNLLLYSVFRIGSPTSNISWQSYKNIRQHPDVRWSIPISLGDSHKSYRVVGTTNDYFKYFKFGDTQQLAFAQGQNFQGTFDVVIGHKVAQLLNYKLGDQITLSHGIGSTSFVNHDKNPFVVSGILQPTGTPVDQSLHVSLAGLEAIHATPQSMPGTLTPKSITAMMIGLDSKTKIFRFQRAINTDPNEPLTAILPGVALAELWQSLSMIEGTLTVISSLVFVSAAIGLGAMLMASIKERTQEVQLLRMLGATPIFIFCFIELEALLITAVSILIAVVILSIAILIGQEHLASQYAVQTDWLILSATSVTTLAQVFVVAAVCSIPAAIVAYRRL